MRFVDTNIFIYTLTGHPVFGKTAKCILERIEKGEEAATSSLVLCEVAWVLEAWANKATSSQHLEKFYPTRPLRRLKSVQTTF